MVVLTLALLFSALHFSTSASAADRNGRRVAFVVGNSSYKHVPLLPNPGNDARAVAAALKRAGFEVITAYDLDRAAFDEEFHKFVRSLSGADVSLFYYSGHGIQVGGDNRLIPIDAELKTAMDLEVETIRVRTILSYMQSRSKVQAIVLDSCRNNPFPARSFLVGPDLDATPETEGLAKEDAATGSLIAYSTQPGNVAVDGAGEFSPFTQAFLKHAFTLGLDLQSAMMKVTQDVWETTNQRQRPWTSYTLVEPLYLAKPSVLIAAADEPVENPTSENNGTTETKLPEEPQLAQNVAGLMSEAFAKPRPVPIGVGAVAMLGDFPIFRGEPDVEVKLDEAPSSGVLYLDGEALISGSIVRPSNLREIAYEPALGSEGSPVGMKWSVREVAAAAELPIEGKVVPFIVDCDREAGEPLDLQGVGPGRLPNEIDPGTAVDSCSQAVEQFPNIARYKYQLGRAKLAAKDIAGAMSLFERAASQGHTRALYQLGYMAQRGLGQSQNLDEATRLFKQGAELGDPYAMLAYGRNLVFGRGTTADPDTGVTFLNRAVELGHTYAMNELGSMYYQGRTVKKNPKRGVRFYEASLARNDIYAMNNLGVAYLDGEGVKKSTATALALFKRASEGGHPEAPGNIGRMYFNGAGVKKNISEAMKWYESGAERGDSWAASNLGWIYQNGPKQVRNIEKSVHYYGFAVALDAYGRNSEASEALKALPDAAKAKVIKQLVAEIGPDNIETASGLDGTLVLLERKAWQRRNPRLDLF